MKKLRYNRYCSKLKLVESVIPAFSGVGIAFQIRDAVLFGITLAILNLFPQAIQKEPGTLTLLTSIHDSVVRETYEV
jgi:hypothetical protein